ncbi:MAG: adenylate kinase [Candidatus Saccharibacteria bacterium]|nr:adenylate kinase [Candidatus Saccharibacteria bacterium]
MSERSLVAITGAGGSGKTNLSRRLQVALDRSDDFPPYRVDHISIGEYVREQAQHVLGRGVLASDFRQAIINHMNASPHKPLDPPVIVGILSEALLRSEADTILLDGFPRFGNQVEQLYETSIREGLYVRAAVITHVNDDEAVRRMLKRGGERDISEASARRRLQMHHIGQRAVRNHFIETGLPFVEIDMYHPKERTLVEAAEFINKTLAATPPGSRQAS